MRKIFWIFLITVFLLLIFFSVLLIYLSMKTPLDENTDSVVCTKNSDCPLPIEYEIRSNCPFTTACENNQCLVICPIYFHSPIEEESKSYQVSCTKDSDCDCSSYVAQDLLSCECIDNYCAAVAG